MADATNSQVNFTADVTRIKAEEKAYKFKSDALTGPKSVWQIMGNVFGGLQDFCNAVNQRLATLEARPAISPLVSDSAGITVKYATVTIGGRQYKIELREMQ